MRQVIRLIASGAVLVAGIGAVPSEAAPRRLGCRPQGSSTITQTRYARLYRLSGRSYGCLYSRGVAYRLGDKTEDESYPDEVKLGMARLAGRYAAFELRFAGRGDTSFEIHVLDLQTGRLRRKPKAYEELAPPTERADSGVTDLVLNPRGSVAWIIRNIYSDPVRLEVHKADSTTRGAVLDAGDAVDPTSLRLDQDRRLTWRNGGVQRTTTLR